MDPKSSVKSIENILKEVSYEELPNILEKFKSDSRQGVQNLIKRYQKKYDAYVIELNRIKKLNTYENNWHSKGYEVVAGIDEVGRGPLAGPVVAAAVILPKDCCILGINDSKKLTPSKREELFDIIHEEAISIGIGIVDPQTIDELNILQATFKAMKIALEKLEIVPDMLIIDGNNTLPDVPIPQQNIVGGDGKSISIAAASIIAKVTRDRIMNAYHELYPEYDFIKHKGYGTENHIKAIQQRGLCPIHRRSFTQNFLQ
ncbi:ribonuclease HII [Defluviitalea raffinosedens]|uniref:Ribonuclease HII n=1 Tax=Defluviitalea raffinosedens TaxID=1450156 RepID=A0A7C8HGF7_9FIRM|nr:ribonuclease HII [Defluviitalea raffinosedens]KAE9637167.1 ribonuclease HII [Defluviitalea raffinosedens]HHW66806.1 ribonuclease HII [Candidatus Epulonipiscium sp.]